MRVNASFFVEHVKCAFGESLRQIARPHARVCRKDDPPVILAGSICVWHMKATSDTTYLSSEIKEKC